MQRDHLPAGMVECPLIVKGYRNHQFIICAFADFFNCSIDRVFCAAAFQEAILCHVKDIVVLEVSIHPGRNCPFQHFAHVREQSDGPLSFRGTLIFSRLGDHNDSFDLLSFKKVLYHYSRVKERKQHVRVMFVESLPCRIAESILTPFDYRTF